MEEFGYIVLGIAMVAFLHWGADQLPARYASSIKTAQPLLAATVVPQPMLITDPAAREAHAGPTVQAPRLPELTHTSKKPAPAPRGRLAILFVEDLSRKNRRYHKDILEWDLTANP